MPAVTRVVILTHTWPAKTQPFMCGEWREEVRWHKLFTTCFHLNKTYISRSGTHKMVLTPRTRGLFQKGISAIRSLKKKSAKTFTLIILQVT